MEAPTYSFEAIGTNWAVTLFKEITAKEKIALLGKIKERIELFDKAYSRFRDDSLVMEMSQRVGTYLLPMDAEILLGAYKNFYDITGGKLTPLVGDVLVSAGYDKNYSFVQSGELNSPPPWGEVLEYNYPKLTLKKESVLDFGAGGKGYLVDIIGTLLEREGVDRFVVDAGGDILVRNELGKGETIGLEDPEDTRKVIGTVEVLNQSIAGSAGHLRSWGEMNHIIDPTLLASPKHILALWIIAKSTLLADLLATALYFVEPEVLLAQYNFEYLILDASRNATFSPGFNAELF